MVLSGFGSWFTFARSDFFENSTGFFQLSGSVGRFYLWGEASLP